jgi:leucyl aminopeptidase
MQFTLSVGGHATDIDAEALVLGVYDGDEQSAALAEADAALGGVLREMRARKEIKGKVGEAISVPTLGRMRAGRLILVGLGKEEQYNAEIARRATAAAAKALDRAGIERAVFELFGTGIVAPASAARAMVEGLLLTTYRFNRYRSEERAEPRLQEVLFLGVDGGELRAATRAGEAIAAGANLARDLANEPPNVLTPEALARRSQQMAAEQGLEVEIFDPEELARRGMGALLAVGQGSENPPRLIILRYMGDAANARPTLGLVGKGITFDTGGISLKPGADMHIMKTDMGGAAAVIGAMRAIAELKPALNVVCIVASAENMPDGRAFRPGDILRAMNGKTIEVQNTDAEGRLVLADALSHAVALGLAPIVDVATLTGACSVALGPFYSACFANDDRAREQVLEAARRAGERLWPLPLDADFRPLLDSSCADMRNVGGREGGAIIAAMFLKEFVGTQPWAHLDIAPTAFADTEMHYYAKGLATGHPVRTLAQLALDLADGERT